MEEDDAGEVGNVDGVGDIEWSEEEVPADEDQEYVFGIAVPDVSEGIQPLECIVLIKGIDMETGMPTMTTIGSEGITPWEALGMMNMEIERIKFMTIYSSVSQQDEE